MNNEEKEFIHYILELMESVGPIQVKRMFNGYGIFLEGLMFALIVKNVLYFKVNASTEKNYTDKGLEAFSYNRQGKKCKLGYFQAPEETLMR